jgi:hypothetical protein
MKTYELHMFVAGLCWRLDFRPIEEREKRKQKKLSDLQLAFSQNNIVKFIHNTLLVFRLELGSSSIRNTFSRLYPYCYLLNAIKQNSINVLITKVSLRKERWK